MKDFSDFIQNLGSDNLPPFTYNTFGNKYQRSVDFHKLAAAHTKIGDCGNVIDLVGSIWLERFEIRISNCFMCLLDTLD